MKEALLFGLNKTIDNYWMVLRKSMPFYLAIVMISLAEGILTYEVLLFVQRDIFGLKLSYLTSLVDFNTNISEIIFGEQTRNYLYDMVRTTFSPILLLNSFLIGVYYSYVGFPFEKTAQQSEAMDVLDVPIGNYGHSVTEMMNYISSKEWQSYLSFFALFFVTAFFDNTITQMLYTISSGGGYAFYLILERLTYVFVIVMYWRFGAKKTWRNEDLYWLFLVFCILLPGIDNYLVLQIKGAMMVVFELFSEIAFNITTVAHFLMTILFAVLWLPVMAIFSAQTFLYYGYEENS